jgi:alpha-amylase
MKPGAAVPRYRRTIALVVSLWLLSACAQATATSAPTAVAPSPAFTATSPAPVLAATATLPAPSVTPLPPTPAPTATLLPYTTPAWFKTAVLYQIFVRSFYDSNGDGIGDLRGIAQKLGYIQSLGANTLWLTPIFASPSYHGYDTTDYYTINPDFGTKQDLIDLLKAAHARGMHVILDYVASHTSDQFPYFKDAYTNPSSKYSDWYIWKDAKHLSYQSFFGVTSLPSINHASEAANAYFVDVAKYWLDPNKDGDLSEGIDGWRCDYALGSPHGFWQQVRGAVKSVNPNALLLGEVWTYKPLSQQPYYKDQFDALFDFPLYGTLMSQMPEVSDDGVLAGQAPATLVLSTLADEHSIFDPQAIPVRFAGNHDTDRIATELNNDPVRLRLTALLLATLDGTPMIYYGDELGLLGHKGGGPVYDKYRREPMDWYASAAGAGETHWFQPLKYTKASDGISVEEQTNDPNSLLNYYRRVLKLRAANPALSSGAYQELEVQPLPGIISFWRYTDSQIVTAIFNIDLKAATISLKLDKAPGKLAATPVDLLTGRPAKINSQALTVQPGQGVVLDWTPK